MSYETGQPIPFRRPRRMEDLRYRIAGRVFRAGQIEVTGEQLVSRHDRGEFEQV